MAHKPLLRIGLKQIALETGHSMMTVSRALNNQPQIAQETRQRILDVAQRLKYRPNLLVRGLQTGRTGTIGVMMPVHDPFYARVFSGIHDQLVAKNHVPILLWSAGDAQNHRGATELAQIRALLDRRVDGIILKPHLESATDAYLQEIWQRQVPLVIIDRELPQSRANFVGTDDLTGGRLAAEYLLKLGHRHLGQLAGSDTVGTYADRRAGFDSALKAKRGATCSTIMITDGMDPWGAAAGLLSSRTRPTAVFLAYDALATPVYDVAAAAGLRIPEDLSVIGFADMASAQALRPKLTTIRQDAMELGRASVELLLGIPPTVESGRSCEKRRLQPELIIRDSTAALEN